MRALLALLALDGDRALSIDELGGTQWARDPQSPPPRILAAGRSGEGKQMLTAADLGESPQRAATRTADAVRSLASAPLQDDMAFIVFRVTHAAASEVAA